MGEKPNSYLRVNESLEVNDYLVSPGRIFFAIMQSDGNFCIYKGTGPSDNRGFLWATNTLGVGGQFFATMQSDGNFCIYDRPERGAGDVLWCSNTSQTPGEFYAIIQDDGNFCIYKGSDPAHNAGFVWDSHVLPFNQNVTDVKALYTAVPDHGTATGFLGSVQIDDLDKSHVQGIAYYEKFYVVTHNNRGHSKGKIIVLDEAQKKLAYSFDTPDEHYNHPGGCQTIGSFLAMAIENSEYTSSFIHFYKLAGMSASVQPQLLGPKIQRPDKGTGAVGITNFTGSDGQEYYCLAALNQGQVEFYRSNARVISDPALSFERQYSAKLAKDDYQGVCLITDVDQSIYLFAFRMNDDDEDFVDLYSVMNGGNYVVERIESRHMYTSHCVSLTGHEGVHFRWGSGLRILSDGQIRLLATQRHFLNAIASNTSSASQFCIDML